jgi:hypothetical protein
MEQLRRMQFYHEALETNLREVLGGLTYFITGFLLRGRA